MLESIATGVGIPIGAITLLLGVLEYIRAQAWKRAEFLAEVIKEFESNPMVHNVLLMLDWEDRPIELFPDMEKRESRFSRVDDRILLKSLATHDVRIVEEEESVKVVPLTEAERADHRLSFSPDQAAIRDCMDEFLNRLERFDSHVRSHLVRAEAFRRGELGGELGTVTYLLMMSRRGMTRWSGGKR